MADFSLKGKWKEDPIDKLKKAAQTVEAVDEEPCLNIVQEWR